MASKILKSRLDKLEAQRNAQAATGQTIERYIIDGEEYIQVCWNGAPGKVMFAWQWDAWDEPTTEED